MLLLEDPFLYLTLKTEIWSLLDSLHILYELRHNGIMTDPSYIRSFDLLS